MHEAHDTLNALQQEQQTVERQKTAIRYWIWINTIVAAVNGFGAVYWWVLR